MTDKLYSLEDMCSRFDFAHADGNYKMVFELGRELLLFKETNHFKINFLMALNYEKLVKDQSGAFTSARNHFEKCLMLTDDKRKLALVHWHLTILYLNHANLTINPMASHSFKKARSFGFEVGFKTWFSLRRRNKRFFNKNFPKVRQTLWKFANK